MAKKGVEFDDLDLDDLEGLDDLDFDGGDLFPDEDSGDRSPAKDLTKSAMTAAKEKILSKDNIKRLIGKTLGTGFSEAIDTYDELSKGVAEVVGGTENEGRSLLRDITGIVDENSPKLASKIPKWARDLTDTKDGGYSEETVSEDDSLLNEDIKGINDLLSFTKKMERNKLSRENLNRIKDAKIADANIKSSSMVISSINRLSLFNEKITINYQKKSLEQGYKIINILGKTYSLHHEQYKLTNEALAGIKKNTGLPDFVKMKGTEFIKANIRQRMADAAVNKLSLGLKPIIDKIKGDISEGIAAIGMGVDMFNVDDGTNPFQIAGSLAGDFLGERVNKLAHGSIDRIKPYLEKLPGFNKVGDVDALLRRFGGNIPMLLNTLAENGHDNEYINSALNYLAPGVDKVGITRKGMLELDDPSYFDVQTHRSINEIIPAYLASIDKNIHELITGEVKPEQHWDHYSGSLVSKHTALDSMMRNIVKDGNVDTVRYEVDTILDSMGAWDLSSSSLNALRVELTRRLLNNVQFKPEMFMDEKMWKRYPDHVHREIRSLIKKRFGMTDEGEFESNEKENEFWDFHRDKFERSAKGLQNYTSKFAELANMTGGEKWLESGLVRKDTKGEYTINVDNFIEELLTPDKEYSYTDTRAKIQEKEAELEAKKNQYKEAFGKGIGKFKSFVGVSTDSKELKDAIEEDRTVSRYDEQFSHLTPLADSEAPVPSVTSGDSIDQGSIDRLLKGSLWDRTKGFFTKKVKDTSVQTKIGELKAVLANRSLDDILGNENVRYDEIFTKEKAEDLRKFLTGTRAGKFVMDKIRKGEEAIANGAFDNLRDKTTGFFSNFAGRARQTVDGFSRGTMQADSELLNRFDMLNETQLASQIILTEMLEVLTQLPYNLVGHAPAGMSVAGFMRDQAGRIKDRFRKSMAGKLIGNTVGLLGTAAKGVAEGGIALGTGTAKGIAGMLPGLGEGIGSLAKGAGGAIGNSFSALTSFMAPLFGVAGSGLADAAKLGMTLAKSPFKGLKMMAKMGWGGKDEYRDYDAYVRGEENPRILSNLLKAGEYRDMDGNEIKSLDQINGALYDKDDNMVISDVEYQSKTELVTASGKLLIKLGSSVLGTGKAASVVRRIFRPVRKVTNAIGGLFKTIVMSPFKLVGGVLGRIKSVMSWGTAADLSVVLSHEQLGVQYKIYELLNKRLSKKGESEDEVDPNTWKSIQGARRKRGEVSLKDVKESIDRMKESTDEKLDNITENTTDKKKGIFQRIFDGIMGLGGIIGTGFKSIGTALAATKIGTAITSAVAGKGFIGGALALGKLAVVGTAKAAWAAATWAATGLAAVVGTTGLVIAGVALALVVGGYFLYKGYKSNTAKKFHLTYLRMLQYGINPADEDHVGRIAAFEAELEKRTSVTSTKERELVHVKMDDLRMETVFGLFGLDWAEFVANQEDKDHKGHKLIEWINHRFLPVYKSHVTACYNELGTKDLSTLDEKVSGTKGISYLNTMSSSLIVNFHDTKYGSPSKAFQDRKSSPFYSNWIRKDVWADEKDIQDAYDRAFKKFSSEQKMTTAVSDTGVSGVYGSRTDQRQIKEIKENSTLMVSNTGTGDMLEINKGIKAGGFFSSIRGANNFKTGDEYSVTKNLSKLDTGSAIRYMMYGLTKFTMIKVEQLWSLERYVLDSIPYTSQTFEYPKDIKDKAVAIFRPDTKEQRLELFEWLENRFLIVLKAYLMSLFGQKRDADVANMYSKLKPSLKYKVIKGMMDLANVNQVKPDGTPFTIWEIVASPWSDTAMNTDATTIDPYVKMIESDVKDKVLDVEDAQKLLRGELLTPKVATLPDGTVTPTVYNTPWSGSMKAAIFRTPQRHSTGTALLMGGSEQIITSGKPHAPLKGHSNEEGEAAMLQAIREAGITDINEIVNIMGQVSEETGRFKTIEENLNYKAERLMAVWPNRFKHRPDFARKLAAGGPEAIANEIYGGRMGNTEPGDGWKYRGRGYIQLTGKDNYKKIGDYLGIDLVNNPDLVNSSPAMAAKTAIAYWMTRGGGLRTAAQRNDIRAVTKLINGGYTGLEAREQHTAHYRKTIPELLANPPSIPASGDGDATPNQTIAGNTSVIPGSAFTSTVPSSTTPSIASVVASAPPAEPVQKSLVDQMRDQHRSDETRFQERQRKRLEAGDLKQEVQVTVEGDEVTRTVITRQLTEQERMARTLENIDAGIAALNKANGNKVVTKASPTRSSPDSRRSRVVNTIGDY